MKASFMNSKAFEEVAPVLLSSSCTVAKNNIGVPQSIPLQYTYRKPIFIDEIRWTITSFVQSPPPGLFKNLGAIVSTKMQLGQMYLMRDPVPIWSLGTVMNPFLERTGEVIITNAGATISVFRIANHRWRLPHPLYVEAGQILSSLFYRGNDQFNEDFTVQVTYAGRTVAPSLPRPKEIPVPYAASFVTPLGAVYAQSNENHLENPFNQDLYVQRMTGRVVKTSASDTTLNATLATTPAYSGALQMMVQIKDSWGEKICQQLTGPSDVWDVARAAWTFDAILGSKGIYEVDAWNLDPAHQLFVGMIGHRMETI